VPASGGAIAWGAATQGGPWDGFSSLNSFEASAGKKVSIFSWYASFKDTDFPTTAATNVVNRGSVPMITWEPWDPANGTASQPLYALGHLADGTYDAYVARWAAQVKAWGGPLRLRFAHEMNGNWYPWGSDVNGNTASQYVAAWRHVHDLFVAGGATNVTWVWTPNVVDGMAPIAPLYPGDAYVDWVGVDGYNWGTTKSWSSWQSFSQVFGSSLAALRQLTTRPIVIGETASTEVGGSKAQWIQDFFTQLKANTDIKAFIWFNLAKETDWRIESSSTATQAFRTGISDTRYRTGA
jgi:beta-mannanase